MVSVTGQHVGSNATYTCDTKFELTTANDTKTCQENGKWTRLEPECVGKQNEVWFHLLITTILSFYNGDCDW